MFLSSFEDLKGPKQGYVNQYQGVYIPEKKRCDHPSDGEVIVAEDVDSKPGKAGIDYQN